MEYSSSEIGDENKENQNVKKTFIVGSPKFSRHPLQQLNNPSVSSPQGHLTLTPYRYHRCRVIPEEIENQENIDPCCVQHENSDGLSKQKPQGTCGDALPDGALSPFAYPHIVEPYQSASSPSTSYSSPVNSAKILHEVNCSNFESPKTSFSTPLRKVNPGGSAYGSCSVLVKTKSEGSSKKEVSKHRSACTSGAYARGGPSSSHSSSSHANSSSLSHMFSVATPSKSAYTPSPSSRSVFRTPSSTYTSSTGDSRLLTPQQRCQSYRQILNPFEVGVDCLQLPTVSPSLFQHVVSPSQETSDNFRWTIDQLAALQPANIETSPYSPGESFPDPDYEQQAQAAIDKFFSQQQVVPSPWTGSNKQINLLEVNCALAKSDSCEPTPSTRTVCCQTELSLPVVLPEQLEEMLKPFLTFTQDQWWQVSNDLDEGNSLNNTTLRRKLLFSQDELMNATPICSPRNTTSSEGSTSSSSMRPLPFHDDDDGHNAVEDDDEDDEGSVWCKDIVGVVSSSARDPNLRRCPPPTPPTRSGHELSQSVNVNVELSETSRMFQSPCSTRCSPNLSPIKAQLQMSPVRHMTLSSPDISPICKNSDKISVAGCPNDAVQMSEEVFEVKRDNESLINAPDISPFLLQHKSSSALTFPETRNTFDGNQTNLSSGVIFEMDRRNDVASAASHKEALIVISQENKVFISDSKPIHKQSPLSETLVTHISAKNIQDENEILLTEMDGTIKKDQRECRDSHHQETEEVNYLQKQCTGSESCDEMKSVPASPKAEKRSSGNMSHFSSSPIRDGMQMPLVIDTACAKFSESPPLSPIFCRSILVQSQPDQHKSHLQKIQECHFTTGNLDQSTLLSVDMEGRSGSEEEIMMEEGIAAAAVPNLSSLLTSNKLFIPQHEYSSVCEMDTDSQQSLEVNVSHEGKSLESGYQTGSLQSTNFNITSFTSNSTIGSMTSFQRDRQVIVCGTDTSNIQYNLGRNAEKMMKSQASLTCKDQI